MNLFGMGDTSKYVGECVKVQARRRSISWAGAAIAFTVTASLEAAEIDYNRDIRPILSNHCLKCHGPDEDTRKAGLRLDSFEAATAVLESGNKSISPNHPEESELIAQD